MEPVAIRPAPSRTPAPSGGPSGNRLEAAFLEEMMKYMGPKPREGGTSGGIGEEQFQSFLTREYAEIMANRIDFKIFAGGQK